jgi:hypothetical protein
MKRIFGRLVDFFPRHLFYSSDFGKDWDFSLPDGTRDDPHETYATTALLATAVAVGKHIPLVGGTATATYHTVTDGGKDIGCFRVTVEKIEPLNENTP